MTNYSQEMVDRYSSILEDFELIKIANEVEEALVDHFDNRDDGFKRLGDHCDVKAWMDLIGKSRRTIMLRHGFKDTTWGDWFFEPSTEEIVLPSIGEFDHRHFERIHKDILDAKGLVLPVDIFPSKTVCQWISLVRKLEKKKKKS